VLSGPGGYAGLAEAGLDYSALRYDVSLDVVGVRRVLDDRLDVDARDLPRLWVPDVGLGHAEELAFNVATPDADGLPGQWPNDREGILSPDLELALLPYRAEPATRGLPLGSSLPPCHVITLNS